MADTTTHLRPIDDDGPGIPEPPDCLTDVQLVSFKANPPSTVPFGDPVTLSWNIDVPGGCPVGLTLNNAPIAKSGSMTVQPATTTTYRILARSLGFSTGLGSVTVPVATEACITGSLGEAEVQSQLRAAINAVDAATSRIKQRSQAAVSVDPNGIKVAVRMEIAINNFPDPDLDVDFTLGLQVRNGAVEPFFHRFSVDVDWPVWVTTVSLGITKIVEEVVENEIEGRLKTEILAKAKEAVGGVLAQLPPALKLHRITLAQDKIDVTVCPAGPDRPHVVLGTRGVGAVLGTAIHRLDDVDPKP